jgi:hypothetical protein
VAAVACLLLSVCSVQGLPRPQQSGTQAILLAPLNFVRGAGQAVLNTGGAVVNSVPSTVDFISNTAVSGVQLVPQTVGAASDFTVNTINGGTRTVQNLAGVRPAAVARQAQQQQPDFFTGTTRFVAGVPGGIVNFAGDVVGAGITGVATVANDGLNLIGAVPGAALGLTGTAVRTTGAVVNGGTRFALATGESAVRTGANTVVGGVRVVGATANSGVQLTEDALRG